MNRFRTWWLPSVIAAFSAVLWAAPLQAQVWVPLDDPAYHELAVLEARGLVSPLNWSQRPFTRYEFARRAAEATESIDREAAVGNRPSWLADIARGLARRFGPTGRPLAIQILEKADGRFRWLRSGFTVIPSPGVTSALDRINAHVDPLAGHTEGQPSEDGPQGFLRTAHWAEAAGGMVSAELRASFYLSDDRVRFDPVTYGARFAWGGAEISGGRIPLALGPGEHGGLFMSDNARSFEQIRAGTDGPRRLPGIAGKLGTWQPLLWFGTLGPEQHFRNTRMLGGRLGYLPSRYFSMAFGMLTIFGGSGAPHVSAGDVARDFFGFLPGVSETGKPISNRIGSAEFRLTIPQLRGFQIYYETVFEDTNSNLKILYKDDVSVLIGLYAPDVTGDGTLGLRLDYFRTGPRAFTHGIFTDGYSLNRRLLSDDLGPQAHRLALSARINPRSNWRATAKIAAEVRDSDTYTTDDPGSGRVVFLARGPSEYRLRGEAEYLHDLPLKGASGLLRFGAERIRNWQFVPGRSRTGVVIEAGLTIEPGAATLIGLPEAVKAPEPPEPGEGGQAL